MEMTLFLEMLNIDPLFLLSMKKAAFISLAIVLLVEWVIWGFLDGRPKKVFSFMRPWFVLNVLVVFASIFLFYSLINHLYVSTFITFLLVALLAVAQVIKFRILGLPVFFWDYTVLREPLLYIPALIQKKSTYLAIVLITGFFSAVFYSISLLPAEAALLKPRVAVFTGAFLFLLGSFLVFKIPYARFFPANSFRDCAVFKTGLLPFIILTARYSKSSPAPQGYSEETIVSICNDFGETDKVNQPLDPGLAPNILFYGIESLMDLKSLGVRLKTKPMPMFSALADKTGRSVFVSPTFGGQTVQPEFELLTGLSQHHLSVPNPFLHIIDNYKNFPALPGVFRKLGYHTLGVQAVSGHEFRRKAYTPLIDFDEFVALESDYPKEDWEMIHHLLADNYLVKKIKAHWPQEDKPVFGLFFSNSTHIAYNSWERKPEFAVLNSHYSEKTKDTLERYASAINQADQAIKRLIDHFETQSRKTIIFFFGDHLPGLNSVFQDLGLFKGDKSFHRFHTPLRIWSNFEVEKVDRIISSNLLAGLLFDILKLNLPDLPLQLRVVKELYQKVDVFSSYIRDKEGVSYSRQHPPEFLQELATIYDQVQYDLLEGKQYVMKHFKT